MTFIEEAQAKFAELITSELARIEAMKQAGEAKDFSQLERIVVGILPGDGIGPIIMKQALRVLEFLAKDEIAAGKLELRPVSGMTIED
ncbi:isocitrate/isopropylmalate dehydrogenase family protein, partial [Klebsiella pneumoniae]|nr:isocitrate/isopropylmalate dehydrogenase family protein [Klebsiella pneumoniae]